MNEPDMTKVLAALERYSKRPKRKDWRTYPVKPSPIAADAAIRKPLKSHGNPCKGYFHPDFLHLD